MFELMDKVTKELTTIYGTRTLDGRIQFLIYYEGFRWNDSSYFEPK